MKVTGDLYSVADTALLLGVALGVNKRQWVDTLNDFRLGRRALKGITLLPYGQVPSESGKARTPRYSTHQILEFVRQIRAAYGSKKPFAHANRKFSYDDTTAISPANWRLRILTPVKPTTEV